MLGRSQALALFVAGALVLVACRARTPIPAPAPSDATPPPPSCVTAIALPRSRTDRSSVLDIAIDLTRCRVTPVVGDHAVTLDALVPPSALLGINGGYFDAHARPLGLRRVAGVDVSPPWSGTSGGVLAFEGTRSYIGPRALLPFTPEAAVQCKPLLVEAGGRNGIVSDDGRRAPRTTVCDEGDGALHLVLFLAALNDGPTLSELAETLRAPRSQGGFGCLAALNLDGGPSTGVWFAPGLGQGSVLPRGPVVDALFVVPR